MIQSALNGLPARSSQKLMVALIGDFIIAGTIKIPSLTIFNLSGSITLANNINQELLQEADPTNGTTQIEMSGGTYDGNADNQSIDNFGINFSKVTNSHFANFIVQNAGKGCFVLDIGCNNNTCDNVTGRSGGTGSNIDNGNGLDDRGDHNTWTNCIAEDNNTDNWVIKCRNSNFINCIGRGSKNTTGFGLFGDRNIDGNKFMSCAGYNNKSNGITLRVPNKEIGKTPIQIQNNFIQGEFYNNDADGVNFADVTTGGLLSQNIVDVLVHDNKESGFYIQQQVINNNSGTIVAYDNGKSDVDIEGNSNNFDIYVPDSNVANIKKGKNINTIEVNEISCSGTSQSWALNKYCQNK